MILGTAAYMAPEQAKGRAADRRSDVWAFGCVLFEMLTGRQAFAGDDVSDTLAAVLRAEPDWTKIPKNVPDHIVMLVKRCLQKDRSQRLADISIALFLMDEPKAGPSSHTRVTNRRIAVTSISAAGLTAIATAIAAWLALRGGDVRVQPTRFAIAPPGSASLFVGGTDRDLVISPDGTHVVYVAGTGQTRLFVRSIDQLEAVPLGNLGVVRTPFISPDSHWVGFVSTGEIKKVSMTGGPAIPVCRFSGAPRGASWGDGDAIVFATSDNSTGLLRVSAAGGEPQVLTKPDPQLGEVDHYWPSMLPGGHGVLFTVTTTGARRTRTR